MHDPIRTSRSLPRVVAALMTAGAALVSPQASAAGTAAQPELSIAPEVLSAMGELAEVSRARPIQRLTQRLPAGGPAGGAVITYEFATLGRNLYGSRTSSVLGEQTLAGTNLTLCGLVELLSTTQAPTTERTAILAVPVGSLFAPLGIRMRTDFSGSSEVTRLALSAPAAQLCEPTPGMRFDYEFDTVARFRTKSGLAKFNSTITSAHRSACTVMEPQPAAAVIDGATEHYLPVSCETTIVVGKSGKPNAIRRELAYLPDAGFYVTLTGQAHTAVQLQDR